MKKFNLIGLKKEKRKPFIFPETVPSSKIFQISFREKYFKIMLTFVLLTKYFFMFLQEILHTVIDTLNTVNND